MNFVNFQNGDWQNFIYLSLLLVFLLTGIVTRRDFKLSQTLKYLAIWGVVGFIFVILFSYRFEFADFKNRIAGEINPNSARLDERGRIVVNLDRDGHFYLNVKINKTPVRFMIDTGASDITIDKSDAVRAGINPKKLKFTKAYRTANGASFGAPVTLAELEISGIKFRRVNASVNSADMGISLLGMSFLRRFKRYEFYQDKLILEM